MLRTDPITGDVRLVAPGRAKRLGPRPDGCPFCPGNEHATPEEAMRLDARDGDPAEVREAGWRARAFPNLFPLSDVHEVLVPTPRHATSMRQLDQGELATMLELWRTRHAELAADPRTAGRYLHLFVNDGTDAGASLPHVHAQLVAVERTPGSTRLTAGVTDPHSCALCGLAARDDLLVAHDEDVVLAAHPVPRMGGSLVLAPARHEEELAGADLDLLATWLHRAFVAMPDGDFNAWIVVDELAGAGRRPHWYIELVPRSAKQAGVELALGLAVSIVDPLDAAAAARDRLVAATS